LCSDYEKSYIVFLKNYESNGFEVQVNFLSSILQLEEDIKLIEAIKWGENVMILITQIKVFLWNLKTNEIELIKSLNKGLHVCSIKKDQDLILIIQDQFTMIQLMLTNPEKYKLEEITSNAQPNVKELSSLFGFSILEESYYMACNFRGNSKIYRTKDSLLCGEISSEGVISSALIFKGKLFLGDRKGNLEVYNIIVDENSGLQFAKLDTLKLGVSKVKLIQIDESNILALSETLSVVHIDQNERIGLYPLKGNTGIKPHLAFLMNEDPKEIIVFEFGRLRLLQLDYCPRYHRVRHLLSDPNSILTHNFKQSDRIKRLIIDEAMKYKIFLTENLKCIVCGFDGSIIGCIELNEEDQLKDFKLINAKILQIHIGQIQIRAIGISCQKENSSTFILIKINLDQSDDVHKLSYDILCSYASSHAMIRDFTIFLPQKILILSEGKNITLIALEIDENMILEKRFTKSVSFGRKVSKTYRNPFIKLDCRNNSLMATELGCGLYIFQLQQKELGENLGYKYDINIERVISCDYPQDCIAIGNSDYIGINKKGLILVQKFQGYLPDTCRKLLPDEKANDRRIFVTGLKGGVYCLYLPEGSLLQDFTLKNLLLLQSFYIKYKLSPDSNVLIPDKDKIRNTPLNWEILNLIAREDEATKKKIFEKFISLLPEDTLISTYQIHKIINEFAS